MWFIRDQVYWQFKPITEIEQTSHSGYVDLVTCINSTLSLRQFQGTCILIWHFDIKSMYLEVSVRVEAFEPLLLQPVSDLYGDSHILGAVCQEHVVFPFFQVRHSHSGFLHSAYMHHTVMNNTPTMKITIIIKIKIVLISLSPLS